MSEKKVAAPREFSAYDAEVNPLIGGFVETLDGTVYGTYLHSVEHDAKTGLPSKIAVRTRDADNQLVIVDAKHVRRAGYKSKA